MGYKQNKSQQGDEMVCKVWASRPTDIDFVII